MFLLASQITFIIQDAYSLKDKRRVIKSMMAKVQQKFKVSVAEVSHNDMQNLAVLGFGIVSNADYQAQLVLDNIHDFIELHYPIEIVAVDWLESYERAKSYSG